jgi:thymidylate kinase
MRASPTTPPADLRSPEAAVTADAADHSVGGAPPGTFAVVGPDGSGKTTLVDALLKTELAGENVLRIRRPGILYRRTPEGIVVTEPHAKAPYSPLASMAKVAYLLTDELLGWAFRLKPFVRRGGTVVIERGWWDLAVDPRRYRLQVHAGLLWRLGRFLPSPDLLVVLEADPDVLLDRKEEISRAELVRQMRAWRELLPPKQRRVYVDAARSPDAVLRETAAAVRGGGLGGEAAAPERPPAGGWIGLPGGDPRWILPRAPRRVAAGGTRVYHPINWRAQTGWAATRAAAALGAFRFVPRRAALPAEVESAMAPYVPDGGTLAVARANHPGRYVALVVDANGRPEALGKVATDPAGLAGLEAEAESLRSLGSGLEAPLAAPGLLGASPGVLVFEVVDYRPRLRPWRLSATVARAAGAFFRSRGEAGAETGASHGDFAPWNLLRRGDRWVLIDWEHARPDAPPWHDVWHYLVQGHALLGRPSQDEIVAGWRGSGWVARALRAYAEGAGLAPEDSERWLDPYLEASKAGLDPGRPDGIAGLRARRRLQARLRA